MKNFDCQNVRYHRDIKGSEKFVTLDISLKFDILDMMIITYPESKVNLGRSGKRLITSLGLQAKIRPKKYKKLWYSIRDISRKDLSKVIREFEKLPYKSHERRRPKYEPTDSYFYLTIQITKRMMRDDTLNSYVWPVRTEMTGTKHIPTSHICSTEKMKWKEFLVDKTLSHMCYTYKNESKSMLVDKCSMKSDES